MRPAIAISLVLGLAACAAPPLVNMSGVDPVVYQRDLDRCQSIATTPDRVGPLVAGAIIGASFGLGAGAFAGPTGSISLAEGYGAAAGTVAGAGIAAVVTAAPPPPPPGPPQETRSVADCLRLHGYKVLAAPP